jgi:hypothetical protein
MRKMMFAFAVAVSLPLVSAAFAQAPAPIQLENVQPISGKWNYRAVAGGSEADFVDAAGTVRLELKCNRAARTVSITRTNVPAAAPTLSIWTTSQSRTVPARYLATKELIADVAATDPLLDAIAFSSGRFATAAAGAPMVAVSAWAEVSRVIEDCRG